MKIQKKHIAIFILASLSASTYSQEKLTSDSLPRPEEVVEGQNTPPPEIEKFYLDSEGVGFGMKKMKKAKK
ncbi:hypothetical protein [Psychromonas sp. KJ10-2]|uniref:hypothetical protein n=1 Tax=Psychromonas sp. KJ10-2 TaxID=3391822 RepID=UPI0039B4B4DB